LQYSTQTSIQLIKYKNNNRIPLQSIPAITLCYENTFQDILFDHNIRQYFINNVFNNPFLKNPWKREHNLSGALALGRRQGLSRGTI